MTAFETLPQPAKLTLLDITLLYCFIATHEYIAEIYTQRCMFDRIWQPQHVNRARLRLQKHGGQKQCTRKCDAKLKFSCLSCSLERAERQRAGHVLDTSRTPQVWAVVAAGAWMKYDHCRDVKEDMLHWNANKLTA